MAKVSAVRTGRWVIQFLAGLLFISFFPLALAAVDLSDGVWRCIANGSSTNFTGNSPSNACNAFLDGTFLDGQPLRHLVSSGACNGVPTPTYRIDDIAILSCTAGWGGDPFSASCVTSSTINICGVTTVEVGSGYLYARTQAAPKVIRLTGPTHTRALPAGPPLQLIATVTQNGYPIAGVPVVFSVDTGAIGNNQRNTTDAAGEVRITYSPPSYRTNSTVAATCDQCTQSTVLHMIAVEACADCALFGNPISGLSGEKLQREVDWTSDGLDPLQFKRLYRSYGNLSVGWGGNWSHNFVATVSGVDNERRVHVGDGGTVLFSRADESMPWIADNRQDSLLELGPRWQYTRGSDQTRWTIEGDHRLVSITGRTGLVTNLTYNDSGQLTDIVSAAGRRLRLNYDLSGHLTTLTTPDAQIVIYRQDASGRLSTVQYPDGQSKTYVYENSLWPQAITGVIDEMGQRYATYTYDNGSGRALSTSHSGGVGRYAFNSISHWSSYPTLAPGSTVDASLYQTATDLTDPLGRNQIWRFRGGDGSIALVGSNGAYDGAQMADRTFVEGAVLPATETDFAGVTTATTWDVARRLPLTRTRAAGTPEAQTISTQWHPTLRLPVLVTEPTRSTAYTYDSAGNKLSETITDTVTGRTRSSSWTYNAWGQMQTATDPNNRVTSYSYYSDTAFTGADPDAIGHTVGDLQSITNAAGHVTRFTLYDKAGRVRQSVDAKGITTDTAYTPRGWLSSTTVTPPGGAARSTSYSYDAVGQLKVVTQPDGATVTYSYDPAHRLIGVKDAKGNEISYTLDNAGNRTAEQIKDPGGTLQRSISRTFDALNRLQQVSGAAQ